MCVREDVYTYVSCVYASMPVVPNPLTHLGQRPGFKDEGSARRILLGDVEIFHSASQMEVSRLFDLEGRKGKRGNA